MNNTNYKKMLFCYLRSIFSIKIRSIKIRNILIVSILIPSISIPSVSLAGYDKLIKDVFPKGTMSNVTASSMAKDQQAGHLMGGSVVIKAPAEPKLQLFNASAPSCKLGGLPCSAQIELFGGALSMISGKELMDYLKGLPTVAATYGAIMLIKTVCPQCEDILEYLDAKADWLNKMSMDKCQMVQNLMDPMFPQQAAKEEGLRQTSNILSGNAKDMSYNQKKSQADDGTDPTKGSQELESQLSDNFNVVWKALAKKASNDEDSKELKEMLMSISGTIIGTKGSDRKFKVRHVKSLVTKDLLKEFIGAGGKESNKIKLYKCNDAEFCYAPIATDKSINKENFLYQRIQKIVESIVGKVLANEGALTAEEETLIALSSEQLILKIEMDLATYAGKANVLNNQTEYIEALSYDVVTGYLQTLLMEVQLAVGDLGYVQMGDKNIFKSFQEETAEVMHSLSEARIEARSRFEVIAHSKERLRRDIDYFDRSFENFVSSQDH